MSSTRHSTVFIKYFSTTRKFWLPTNCRFIILGTYTLLLSRKTMKQTTEISSYLDSEYISTAYIKVQYIYIYIYIYIYAAKKNLISKVQWFMHNTSSLQKVVSLYSILFYFMYIYICVCVCVCVLHSSVGEPGFQTQAQGQRYFHV